MASIARIGPMRLAAAAILAFAAIHCATHAITPHPAPDAGFCVVCHLMGGLLPAAVLLVAAAGAGPSHAPIAAAFRPAAPRVRAHGLRAPPSA